MGLTADLGRCPREHPRMEIHILSINAACIAPGVDTVTIRYHRAQAEACDDFTLLVYDCNGVLVYQQDFNAVPPLGIEGIKRTHNGEPLLHAVNAPGAVGIGALAIGDIKYKLQNALLASLLSAEEPVYLDFRAAFEQARALV